MENGEKWIYEADFFVGYQRQAGNCSEECSAKKEGYAVCVCRSGLKDSPKAERQKSREEEGEALREVIMPVIATIKYGKVLVDVKVEPLIWWECPFAKVKSI